MGIISSLKNYFSQTHSILYSYFLAIPLLILYEVLIRVSQPGQEQMVRISVDVWFSYFISAFGFDALTATFLIAALVGLFVIIKKRHQLRQLKMSYFGLMIVEAAIYAVGIAIIISLLIDQLLFLTASSSLSELSTLQLFALSLGAGLYEELFFRVILVSILLYLLKLTKFNVKWQYLLAIVTAALIFSAVHYIGEYGDPWALNTFIFRFLFGLALNLIYVKRGFGSAAWTHALYDVIVILGR